MLRKKCPRCAVEKEVTSFQKNKVAKDGLQYHCKVCRKEIDSRPEHRAQHRERYHNNKDNYKDGMYKRKYGITLEKYNKLLESQNNVCAICQLKCSSGRNLAVDHDHTTGKVRGLLCGNCNTGLGSFKDNPTLLKEADAYLCKHN